VPTKKTSAKSDREKRLEEITKESQYKTIGSNPEVFQNHTCMVSDIKDNPDGSSTITIDLDIEQRDMFWDVFLRSALVEGLKTIDANSARFAEQLKLIEMTQKLVDMLVKFETSDEFDYSPKVSNYVKKVQKQLDKISKQ
jgi:hypothetical protein